MHACILLIRVCFPAMFYIHKWRLTVVYKQILFDEILALIMRIAESDIKLIFTDKERTTVNAVEEVLHLFLCSLVSRRKTRLRLLARLLLLLESV